VTRVDAHHHVWDLDRRPQPWTDAFPVLQRSFGLDELVPELDRAGVDGTVVVQTADDPAETHELLDLAMASARVLGVVGWFDLAGADLAERLAEVRSHPACRRLVGARHQLQVEPDQDWLGRDSVRSGLLTLAEHDLVFDVVVSPEQLPLVIETVAALGEVLFVLDHAGKPPLASGDLTGWTRDVRRLAALPNIAVKLSGLVTEADWGTWNVDDLRPAVDVVLDAFGTDRTMTGSDWPVCLLAATYPEVTAVTDQLTAGLSEAELHAVRGETAVRWYGLEDA
jgi:L-fuconolactonase